MQHAYAQEGANERSPSSLSEIGGGLSETAQSVLRRLRRINGHLIGGGDADKPGGPRPVSVGIIRGFAETLEGMNQIQEEIYRIEMAIGIDSPPTSTAGR